MDPDLLQYDEVWAAAGTWNENFGAARVDIVRVAGGVVADRSAGVIEQLTTGSPVSIPVDSVGE